MITTIIITNDSNYNHKYITITIITITITSLTITRILTITTLSPVSVSVRICNMINVSLAPVMLMLAPQLVGLCHDVLRVSSDADGVSVSRAGPHALHGLSGAPAPAQRPAGGAAEDPGRRGGLWGGSGLQQTDGQTHRAADLPGVSSDLSELSVCRVAPSC